MSCICDWFDSDAALERKRTRREKEAAAPPSLYRTKKERSCTDVVMLLLYILSWGGMAAILGVAVNHGADPNRITHGVDFQGRICGVDAGVFDAPYAGWVAMPINLEPGVDCSNCYQIQVCLHACNETMTSPHIVDKYESDEFLNYCLPTVDYAWAYDAEFQSVSATAARAFADLYICWPALLITCSCALVAGFIYTWLSKEWAGAMVLVACILTLACGAIVTYALFAEASFKANTDSSNQATVLQIVGTLCGTATLVFLCILVAIRNEIRMAISLSQEASKTIIKLPWLIIFPIIPSLVGAAYLVWFVASTVLICSVWTFSPAEFPSYITNKAPQIYGNQANATFPQYQEHSSNQVLQNSFAYLLLHLLWHVSICTYFTYMVVTSAVTRRYFSQALQPRLSATSSEERRRYKQAEAEAAKLQNVYFSDTPVTDAVMQTLRFHMGTVLLAAAVMSLLNLARAIATYLERRLKAGGTLCCVPSRCQNACFTLLQCAVSVTQCCLTQVNRCLLLWTGVFGTDFCASAQGSFQLIFANLAHAAAVNMVGWYLMVCGKLFVASGVTAISALVLPKYYHQLSSLILPLVVIFLGAYQAASAFMTVLETAIDATFFAFLLDVNVNASSGAMHASARLQRLVFRDDKSEEAVRPTRNPAAASVKQATTAAVDKKSRSHKKSKQPHRQQHRDNRAEGEVELAQVVIKA